MVASNYDFSSIVVLTAAAAQALAKWVGAEWKLVLVAAGVVLFLRNAWWIVELLWWKPMRIAKKMKSQGIKVLPYHVLGGDLVKMVMLAKAVQSQPMDTINHDIVPRILPTLRPWVQSHGKLFVFWFGMAAPTLIITDPEMVKEVMSTKSSCFHRGALEARVLENFVGRSIFTVEDDEWVYRRHIITSGFLTEKLKGMLESIITSANELMKRWEYLEGNGLSFEVDVSREFYDLARDVFCRTAFGNSTHEQAKKFGVLQAELKEILMSPSHALLAILFPSYRLFPTPDNLRVQWIKENMDKIVREMIQQRVEQANKLKSQNYGNDLLGSLLYESQTGNRGMKVHKKKLSTSDVMTEFNAMFYAGNESTSNLISWTIMLLSLHPQWQKRARTEIMEVCNNSPIDDEKLRGFKLLTTILQEASRLYPAVSDLTRVAVKNTTIGGVSVPEGLQVWVPILQIHRDLEQWGNDALEFKPSRFGEGAAKACKNPHSYMPFSCGQRTCVGQIFAMMEAKVVLATILQCYSFQLSPNYKHGPRLGGSITPQYGMPIIFQNLKSAF